MLVCVVLSCLLIAALWSLAEKELTSWLSCVVVSCVLCALVNFRIKGEVGAVKLVLVLQ